MAFPSITYNNPFVFLVFLEDYIGRLQHFGGLVLILKIDSLGCQMNGVEAHLFHYIKTKAMLNYVEIIEESNFSATH